MTYSACPGPPVRHPYPSGESLAEAPPHVPTERPSLALQALLGGLVLILGILAMPAEQYIGDPMAVRMVTWSLLERGRLDVPEELARSAGEPGQYFVQNPENGRYYSKYGELNTLGYVPAMLAERALWGRLEPVDNRAGRTILLNVGNLVLSLVLACLLLALALQFTGRSGVALVWVLATLYASFGWNYLRAQTTELLQWTLATGFFLALVRLRRTQGSPHGLLAVYTVLALLLLSKAVYVLLFPVVVAVVLVVETGQGGGPWLGRLVRRVGDRPGWLLRALVLPLAGLSLLVLALNEFKFGSPLATGYTQWVRERDLFRGDLWAGVWGFVADPQRSILLHQPLLLPAILALPAFFRRWRLETSVAWLTLSVFLLFHARTVNWAGHWSYGPRYLLPVLAPATLSSLFALEYLADRWRTWSGACLAGSLALILVLSLWLQVQVNALGFFTYYQAEAAVKSFPAPAALRVLQGTPFGLVGSWLRDYSRTSRFPPFLEVAAGELTPEQTTRLAEALLPRIRGNLLWFPGP